MNTYSNISPRKYAVSETADSFPTMGGDHHREGSRSPSLFSRWVSLSEAQWIVIEASAGALCLGGAAVFGLMAPNMPWTALVASTGAGLAAGIVFLASLATYGSFKRLNEIEESAKAKTRYLEANVYHWKQRAEEEAYVRSMANVRASAQILKFER